MDGTGWCRDSSINVSWHEAEDLRSAQTAVSRQPGAAHCKASGTLVFSILAQCCSQHAVFAPAGAHSPDWKGLYQIQKQSQAPGT